MILLMIQENMMPTKIKIPRTPHLSFSKSISEDDLVSDEILEQEKILATEKLDGSSVAIDRNNVYSRSGKPATKKMFDLLKAYHAKVSYLIPEKYVLYGEWLHTPHSIEYENLPEIPLFLFASRYIDRSGIGNQIVGGFKGDVFEDFDSMEYWADKIGIQTVPTFGAFNPKIISAENFVEDLVQLPSNLGGEMEGVVARSPGGFKYSEYEDNVSKYVRKDFTPGSKFVI